MKMQEIRAMSKKYGINSFGKSKDELIREIQRAEGNFDCFGTAQEYCDQLTCSFRTVCLPDKGKKKAKMSAVAPSA